MIDIKPRIKYTYFHIYMFELFPIKQDKASATNIPADAAVAGKQLANVFLSLVNDNQHESHDLEKQSSFY